MFAATAKFMGWVPQSRRLYVCLAMLVLVLATLFCATGAEGMKGFGLYALLIVEVWVFVAMLRAVLDGGDSVSAKLVATPKRIEVVVEGAVGEDTLPKTLATMIAHVRKVPEDYVPLPSGTVKADPTGVLVGVPASPDQEQALYRADMDKFLESQRQARAILIKYIGAPGSALTAPAPTPALPPATEPK